MAGKFWDEVLCIVLLDIWFVFIVVIVVMGGAGRPRLFGVSVLCFRYLFRYMIFTCGFDI